jgi:hypothetical protein
MAFKTRVKRQRGRITNTLPRAVAVLSAMVSVTALLFKVWPV